MTHPARRFRRWVMAAAPGMTLMGGWLGAAGAASLLLAWLLLGSLLPPLIRLPYAHRRRVSLHRLFLGFAAGTALLCGAAAVGRLVIPPTDGGGILLIAGAACFSVILCQQTVQLTLPRSMSWAAGCALCAAAWAVSR